MKLRIPGNSIRLRVTPRRESREEQLAVAFNLKIEPLPNRQTF